MLKTPTDHHMRITQFLSSASQQAKVGNLKLALRVLDAALDFYHEEPVLWLRRIDFLRHANRFELAAIREFTVPYQEKASLCKAATLELKTATGAAVTEFGKLTNLRPIFALGQNECSAIKFSAEDFGVRGWTEHYNRLADAAHVFFPREADFISCKPPGRPAGSTPWLPGRTQLG